MTRKLNLRARDVFALTQPGRFYWRLLVLPFIGAFMAFITFLFSVNNVDGESLLPLSYPAVFYTVFLLVLWWIASSLQDQLFSLQVVDVIMLWPLSMRKKYFWLYFRSTWIPAMLLLLGAIPGAQWAHGGVAARMLLSSFPYGLAAGFFLSILFWKGSFTVVDVGSFIGKVSAREGIGLSLLTLIVCLSPVALDVLPNSLQIAASLLFVILAFVYAGSTKYELQAGGGGKHPSTATQEDKPRDLSFLASVQRPWHRYFCFLEWDDLKKPLRSLLVNGGSAIIIVVIYYAFGGLFSPDREVSLYYHSLYLSLMVCLTTFSVYDGARIFRNTHETLVLLPLSPRKKALAHFLHRLIRPSIYSLCNVIGVVFFIAITRSGLSLITPRPHPPYGQLLLQTFRYTLVFLPLTVALLSLLEFLLKTVTVTLQRLKVNKVAHQIFNRGSFYLFFAPPVAIGTVLNQSLSRVEVFLGTHAVLLYVTVLLLSQLGLYWTSKRIQVLST